MLLRLDDLVDLSKYSTSIFGIDSTFTVEDRIGHVGLRSKLSAMVEFPKVG